MRRMPGHEHKGSEVTEATRIICAADKALIAAETSRNLELAVQRLDLREHPGDSQKAISTHPGAFARVRRRLPGATG